MSGPRHLALLGIALLLAGGLAVLHESRRPEAQGPYDLASLKRLPVSGGGRVKPLDTVARNSLMIISGKSTLEVEGERWPAIRWLAEVVARPEAARQRPVFRVAHPGLRQMLELEPRSKGGPRRVSYQQIGEHRRALRRQAQRASRAEQADRSAFERRALTLFRHFRLYQRLERLQKPYAVPPFAKDAAWQPVPEAIRALQQGETEKPHPALAEISGVFQAYRAESPEQFNKRVAGYLGLLESRMPEKLDQVGFEVLFNRVSPFYQAAALYVLVFLLASAALAVRALEWRRAPRVLGCLSLWLLGVTLLVHTFGIGARIWIQGRPPVTNLYSSAVFIGWACVVFALALEWLYRLGVGPLVAALTGFGSLVIAHHLAEGDTMEMMQAVLDSNFWLSTHVVTITLGYSATFLAGFLGLLFILFGVFTPWMHKDLRRRLGRMVYGVVCFAALLSFVGTVLGGIWADQSWGRFWGWDPKENGAALIVLMTVLILHARWGGMVKERGIMVLAVCGNIVTSWSWFGTNMLGVGLHSYGFMDSAMFWLLAFVSSQLAVIAVGLLPMRFWMSAEAEAPRQRTEPAAVPAGK